MLTTSPLEPADLPMAGAENVVEGGGPGGILSRVFETLDRAGIPYCVLHGYESYPRQIKSDVDCVIDPQTTAAEIHALLHHNSARIGAEIVRCRRYHIVLAGKNADGSRCFLTLDLSVDCAFDDMRFYAGTEVLASRRRHRQFWIPAAHVEFGCYLARTIAKGCLDDARGRRLSTLYWQDAAGCAPQVGRFWAPATAEVIISAAISGDWQPVRRRLSSLQGELRRRVLPRWRLAVNKFSGLATRLMRVWRPDGLNVVLLGPDGAGKSSVIDALSPSLAGAFARSTCRGFAPPLHRLFRRSRHPTDQPHALPARSLLISLLRAGYWFAYATLGYGSLRLALARSTLVLNDRHLIDILVDPKRYRYGGPVWLMWAIWRLSPKPDLIILLDAPPEVLQARKQEVSFEESARQRRAYLSLVRSMRNGHVVDAARPLQHVTRDVSDIILRHLTMRIARNLLSSDAAGESVPQDRPARADLLKSR